MPLKILLADDSMTAQKLGKDILTGAGYQVIAVSNGAAAAKKLAEKPDIIILDVFMPGYSGLEICEKVRASADLAKTPVLLTVGKMEPYKPEDGQRVGADGVIVKPFEASDLLAAVQKLAQKSAAKAAAAQPAYEKTMIFQAPNIEEFKDPSYNDWKSAEAEEPPPAPKMQMSSEAGSAPAFMMDEAPPVPTSGPSTFDETVHYPPPAKREAASRPDLDETASFISPYAAASAAPVASAAAGFGMDFAVNAPIEAAPESHHDVEFTATSKAGDYEVEREAGLEHTNVEDTPGKYTLPTQDPALVTDPTTMATEFATKFGVDHEPEFEEGEKGFGETSAETVATVAPDADDFEARVAAAMSGFGDEATTEVAPAEVQEEEIEAEVARVEPVEEEEVKTAPQAAPAEVRAAPIKEPIKEEEPAKYSWSRPTPYRADKEDTQKFEAKKEEIVAATPSQQLADSQLPPEGMQDASLVEQMHAAFADVPVETAPAVEEPVDAPAATSTQSPFEAGKPDIALANALAAAVGSDAAQAGSTPSSAAATSSSFDASTAAHVVNKVLERMLPAIMVEVAKELDSAKKPK